MARKIITSKSAPEPIGPYSQAVQWNDLIFTSGQIAIDPQTGALVQGGVAEQTRQVIANLSQVLMAAGASLESVIKTTIFLKDINDFAQVNQIYAESFGRTLPARSTVEVSALPKNALVEIDCIATVSH
ncbi:MAG: RidA family protein [Calditrichales bacterium]|nr:MAG: RidA family protein [Calditrichales bacterium]